MESTAAAGPLAPVRAFWRRTEAVRGPAFFLGGFGWDWATLRIERIPDNLLLVGYFGVLVAVFVVELRSARGSWVPGPLKRWPAGPALVGQFFLGSLLSAFAVHVFSATHPGPVAWFLGLLFALMVANEAGVGALRGAVARVALVGFLGFQLASLVLPLLTGILLGPPVPLFFAGLGVLGLLAAVLVRLTASDPPVTRPELRAWEGPLREVGLPCVGATGALFSLLVLIGLGVVPPLPLVMRDAVVARDVRRVGAEVEIVEPHRRNPVAALVFGPARIRWAPGQRVAVYTAVFAPRGMELEIVHAWDWWDPERRAWTTSDQIRQKVKGGRVDGFRTWSAKRHLKAGHWRVRVQTGGGREIGRVPLQVDVEG